MLDVRLTFLNAGMEEKTGTIRRTWSALLNKSCNPAYRRGEGRELSLHQPKVNLLEEDKNLYQPMTFAVMYPWQFSRYGIRFVVNQLARALSRPSKFHFASLLELKTIYRGGGLKLAAYLDANSGNSPNNGKSMSSYVLIATGFTNLKGRPSMSNRALHYRSGACGRSAHHKQGSVLL